VTIAGSSAAKVGWVTASPVASSASSAIISTGSRVNARPAQTAACRTPTTTSSVRLSNRSTSRPASGANTNSGSAAARKRPETASPPAPDSCSARASVVAASASPAMESPRHPAATWTSRQSDVKGMLRK
jgi:hypothetical protein